jgi:glycerol-3-phosphate dehydrogenase
MDRANIVIVGGGVIGCAIAMELSRRWDDVFVLEQLPRVGMATSTRNSGVIHSGLYYPAASLKARHAVEGNRLMYEFCAAHRVPHRRTGKLVVATHAGEEEKLAALVQRGRSNGVEGLRIVDRAAIRKREPHIEGHAAIEVPSTGIVMAEELVKTCARLAAEQGVSIVTHARVTRLEPKSNSVAVTAEIGDPSEPASVAREAIETRCLVNSAGLFADDVAAMLGNTAYRIYPVRGEYCEIHHGRMHLINGLVYPLPHPQGLSLGVHFTRTLWNTVLVGPTARYITDKNDYERDRLPREAFLEAAKPMVPELELEDLVPAYSGIRPKLVPPGGNLLGDFVIRRDPGVPCAIQLIGMESPGLTGALSIARQVAEMAREILS